MKKTLVMALLTACLVCMTGCSYKNMEDAFRKEVTDVAQTITNETDNGSETDQTAESINDADSDGQIHQIGDTVVIEWPIDSEGGTASESYCVTDVAVLSTLEGSGITPDDFLAGELYRGDIPEGQKLVLASVHLKNISHELLSDPDIDQEERDYPFCVTIYGGNAYNLFNSAGITAMGASYFSEHPDGNERKYYGYYLEPGAEMDYKIGWLVPENMLQDAYYYVLGADFGITPQFIQLTEGK